MMVRLHVALASPPDDIHVSRQRPPNRWRGERLMDQFDIIVIGGGSAGSAAAGRLAEDGKRTVCLVEAGGTNDTIRVKTQAFMPFIPKSSKYRSETVPHPGLKGRIGYHPRGRGHGGARSEETTAEPQSQMHNHNTRLC